MFRVCIARKTKVCQTAEEWYPVPIAPRAARAPWRCAIHAWSPGLFGLRAVGTLNVPSRSRA